MTTPSTPRAAALAKSPPDGALGRTIPDDALAVEPSVKPMVSTVKAFLMTGYTRPSPSLGLNVAGDPQGEQTANRPRSDRSTGTTSRFFTRSLETPAGGIGRSFTEHVPARCCRSHRP
jgi:hypothetical protein